MSEPVLACQALRKVYRQGDTEVQVLLGVDLDVQVGERVWTASTAPDGAPELASRFGLQFFE